MFWITRSDKKPSHYSIWELKPTRLVLGNKTFFEFAEEDGCYEPLEIHFELFESLVKNVRLAPNHILKVKEFRAITPKRRLRQRYGSKK